MLSERRVNEVEMRQGKGEFIVRDTEFLPMCESVDRIGGGGGTRYQQLLMIKLVIFYKSV